MLFLPHHLRTVESLLCVGLDPHLDELPKEERSAVGAVKFCKRQATILYERAHIASFWRSLIMSEHVASVG